MRVPLILGALAVAVEGIFFYRRFETLKSVGINDVGVAKLKENVAALLAKEGNPDTTAMKTAIKKQIMELDAKDRNVADQVHSLKKLEADLNLLGMTKETNGKKLRQEWMASNCDKLVFKKLMEENKSNYVLPALLISTGKAHADMLESRSLFDQSRKEFFENLPKIYSDSVAKNKTLEAYADKTLAWMKLIEAPASFTEIVCFVKDPVNHGMVLEDTKKFEKNYPNLVLSRFFINEDSIKKLESRFHSKVAGFAPEKVAAADSEGIKKSGGKYIFDPTRVVVILDHILDGTFRLEDIHRLRALADLANFDLDEALKERTERWKAIEQPFALFLLAANTDKHDVIKSLVRNFTVDKLQEMLERVDGKDSKDLARRLKMCVNTDDLNSALPTIEHRPVLALILVEVCTTQQHH